MCPIDYKRALYSNIIVTGGSSQFIGFHNRLQAELKDIVSNRQAQQLKAVGG